MEQLTWIAQILKTNLATLNVLRNVLMHSIKMRQNQTAKNTVTLTIATSHHLVQNSVLMLQRMNNVLESVNNSREILNVALNALKIAKIH